MAGTWRGTVPELDIVYPERRAYQLADTVDVRLLQDLLEDAPKDTVPEIGIDAFLSGREL
jgi:hypothetical protein